MPKRTSAREPALFVMRKLGEPEHPQIIEQLRIRDLPMPEEEFYFASAIGRNWRFDFAWPSVKTRSGIVLPDFKVALEQEGGVFGRNVVVEKGYEERKGGEKRWLPPGTKIRRTQSRHATGEGLREDAYKYNRAQILGWLVVRATTDMVRDGHAIHELLDAFRARGWQD